MNRNIRFRAWDKEYENMTTAFLINPVTGMPTNDVGMMVHLILMQFTGLKDKNGKEIYEGDIVNTNNETPFIVKYDNTCCAFLWGDYYFEDRVEERKVKIIGNIYENPELIK